MKRALYFLLFIIFFNDNHVFASPHAEEKQDSVKKEKKWSLGYMGAFYYDKEGFLLFPLGLAAEYKLNNKQSIDIQGVNYYLGKNEDNSLFIYNYRNRNFSQVDIGFNVYFNGHKRKNEGIYLRTSLGTFLYYEHSILHLKDENLGIETEKLIPKAFVGIQVGAKNRFTERLYYKLSVGSTFSIFSDDFNLSVISSKVILISPYVALGIGVTL